MFPVMVCQCGAKSEYKEQLFGMLAGSGEEACQSEETVAFSVEPDVTWKELEGLLDSRQRAD